MLDDDKLETLRRWGQGLEQADGEESAAAGRAILMLIAEVDRLQIDLRLVRERLSRVTPPPSDAPSGRPEAPVASTLHGRLQRVLKREPDASPRQARPRSTAETDGTLTSPQAWIESLRRQ